MANEELFAFNKRDGKRIAKSVRRTERSFEGSTSNPQPPDFSGKRVVLVKLTNKIEGIPEKWAAIEVGYDTTSGTGLELEELPNPRVWGSGSDLGFIQTTFSPNTAVEGDVVQVFLKYNVDQETGVGRRTAQWFLEAHHVIELGCHVLFDDEGNLTTTVVTLLGGNAQIPEDPLLSKYLIFFDGPDNDGTFPCLFIDLNCEILVADLSGFGLKIQDPPVVDEPCKIQIEIDDTSCDALQVDEFGLSFDADPLAGNGLVNLFDCELSILIDPACNALSVGPLGLLLDLVVLTGVGLKEGAGPCEIQLGFDTLTDGDLTTRVDFAFFDGDIGAHRKGQFRDEGGYVTLNNQLLAHNSAEDFVWIDGDEAINLTGNTINVLHRFSIDRDIPTNSLEFVNDVDLPGNNFFYGTNDIGTKNWIDLESLAGAGISFDNNFDLDIMELAIGVPSPSNDYFAFGDVLGVDNERVTINGMLDAAMETRTVITDIRLDGSDNLQIKTTVVDVYNPQTESVFTLVSGWTTVVCT